MKKISILLTSFLLTLSSVIFGQTTYVTTNQTWDTPGTYEKIEIGNLATLTIKNTTIKMLLSIKIWPGAKLIVDHSTITHSEFTEYWHGIEIGDAQIGPDIIGLKGSVEIKNRSLIQWAYIGVDMYYDGNLNVSGSSTFLFNRWGVHLRLWPKNHYGNPNISIQNTNFNSCTYNGIEVHDEAGVIDISNCTFQGNGNSGILFLDDNHRAVIPTVENCNFIGEYEGIRCSNIEGLTITNCNFESSPVGNFGLYGIHAINSDGLEFIGNNFQNLSKAGISASESDFYAHDQNIFESCATGIFASTAETSSHFTLDGNYFIGCDNGLDISGYDDLTKTNITNNTFEDCEFSIAAFGSNHFNAVENMVVNSDYGILVNSTGEDVNLVGCNELNDPESGVQIHYNNDMTTFVGNVFNRTGWSDVLLRSADTDDNIGNKDFPALNIFSDHGHDISLYDGVSATDPFNYWLPKDPPANIDPDNIPDVWKDESYYFHLDDCNGPVAPAIVDDQTLQTWKEDYCYWYDLYKNEDNITNKENYYNMKKRLLRYLYYHLHPVYLTEWQRVEAIMNKYCDWWRFQKYQVKYYLVQGDCNKVDSLLSALEFSLRYEPPYNNLKLYEQEKQSKQAFVNIYRIILSKQCDQSRRNEEGEFVFSNDEVNLLYNEAQKNIPEAGYARALYYTATGEILPINSYIEFGSGLPEPIVLRTKTETSTEVYPNPATDFINITYNKKIIADVILSDVFGKVVFEQKVDFSKNSDYTITVKDLNSNIYFLTIADDEGQVDKIEKIVITK